MRLMEINRRWFLGSSLATLFPAKGQGQNLPAHHIATTGVDQNGTAYACLMDPNQDRLLWQQPLTHRGHGMAYFKPADRLVFFARRPGVFWHQYHRPNSDLLFSYQAPAHRHVYGHGVFDQHGLGLFCPENDFAAAKGKIAYYGFEANGPLKRQEWDSGAIGPHEIAMMPAGGTGENHLVIAHGGVHTHPQTGRKKHNLATMQPELTFWSCVTKQPTHRLKLAPELAQLSIRHLAIRPDGLIVMVMQYYGPQDDLVPLIGLYHLHWPEIRLLKAPFPEDVAMKNYCGSVVFSANGDYFAVSCPRGGRLQIWEVVQAEARLVRSFPIADVCGLAQDATGHGFYASTGYGRFFKLSASHNKVDPLEGLSQTGLRYDNHMLRL